MTVTGIVVVAGRNVASPALVAVTVQLPTPVAVSAVPLREQEPAPDVTVYVVRPDPEPPLEETVVV